DAARAVGRRVPVGVQRQRPRPHRRDHRGRRAGMGLARAHQPDVRARGGVRRAVRRQRVRRAREHRRAQAHARGAEPPSVGAL
ncbi:MAG: hypothetical protein AVDCRST_MAG40-1115, partial [uncultured Gemmatimonadaceae bacterium]